MGLLELFFIVTIIVESLMLHVINVSIRWLSSMHMESGIIRFLTITIFVVFFHSHNI